MIVKGENRKIALAYFKHRFPVNSEMCDINRSQPFFLQKNTVIIVHSDIDTFSDFLAKHERYQFVIHKPGKNEADYWVHDLPKKWIFDYYDSKIKRNESNSNG